MTTLLLIAFLAYLGITIVLFLRERRKKQRFLSILRQLSGGVEPEDILAQEDNLEQFSGQEQTLLQLLSERLQETSAASLLKNEAEMHALQNQINPHFLYNTLEVIRSRALARGNQDVAEMVEALALQFRYCINRSDEMATLQQELDHVKNYLLIQRYRLGDRFSYREMLHDEDGTLLQSRLPVMTLQPIVENALLHGINPKIEGGTLTIRARAASGRLYLSVEDDGIGMDKETLERMRRVLQTGARTETGKKQGSGSLGIAMPNVNRRIKFYFGENYGIDLASTEGVGTSVFLVLPLGVAEEEDWP